MKPSWIHALMVVTSIGVVARFTNLENKFFWIDETYSALVIAGTDHRAVTKSLRAIEGEWTTIAQVRRLAEPTPERGLTETVQALWTGDPHHCPLYFVLAHGWAKTFGPEPASLRALSATLSLGVLLFLWLLLGEIRATPLARWITLALTSISPFFLIYAQQAREYGLWTTTCLALVWSLVRAFRRQTLSAWALYSVCLIVTLYTDLLSLLLIAGLGLAAMFHFRSWRRLQNFFIATAVGVAAFLPWLLNAFQRRELIANLNEWSQTALEFPLYVQRIAGFTKLFWDTGIGTYKAIEWMTPRVWVPGSLITLVMAVAIHRGWKKLSRHHGWWVIGTALPIPLLLIGLDLAVGGRRGTIFRYLMPLWTMIFLLIGVGFAGEVIRRNARARLAQVALAGLFALEMMSSLRYLRQPTWWTSHPTDLAETILRLNREKPGVPILAFTDVNPAHLISAAYSLNPETRLQMTDHAATTFPSESEWLVFGSTPEWRMRFKKIVTFQETASPLLWIANHR